MSDTTVLYLSRMDVEAVGLPMAEIISGLEEMFLLKGRGDVEMPPKPGIHTRPDAFIHAMPAYIPGMQAAGMKWVSGYPDNVARGMPYINGLLVLNDPDTGYPLSVMDCTWITGMRTGAATAVAAKHLARPESTTAGIVACGVQGRSNLEALSCVFELTGVKAFDVRPETAEAYAREMAGKLGLKIEPVANLEEAVRGRDLVVTSGPILREPAPEIGPGWLDEGAFACPLDFDSYWQGEAFREADRLATDDMGQMTYYREEGYFGDTPEPYADLGEIVSGKKPGRQSDSERNISVNLGLGLEDMATAVKVYERAREQGIGRELPL